jgi:YrbI family 3-deoxy-D-manno-octulosonate 8-phosphate phosphatase
MKTVCAYISACCAGSAVPLQSIKSIAHRPLAYWAINAALSSPSISKIYIATDSEHIQRVLTENFKHVSAGKISFLFNSKNISEKDMFLEFCNERKEAEYIVWVNAHALLLHSEQLEQAISIINAGKVDSVIGGIEQHNNIMRLDENGLLVEVLEKQDDKHLLLQDTGYFSVSIRDKIVNNANRISGRIACVGLPVDSMLYLNSPSHWQAAEHYLLAHHPEVAPRKNSKPIKMVMMGVDGILTDSSVYYDVNGGEIKRFSSYDSTAFRMLHERGYKTAIIASHNNPITKIHAEKIGVHYILQGVTDKLATAQEICLKEGIELSDTVFIGDDLNDISLLKEVGIAACPSNAVGAVKSMPGIINLTASGGNGVLRSMLKYIFGEVLPEEVAILRNHLQVHRPWGSFEVLTVNNGYKAKRISVRSDGKLSLQLHHHRSEHWIVVQGRAYVTLGEVEKEYDVGEHIFIPVGTTHRLENRGNIPLEILEIALGSYLEEDDIVRLEDIYGRA